MSEFSRETLLNIIETDHVQCGEASALARMALAAMDSESGCLPLDYLQGHKDGLEWASQLAEANHPDTGDWLYDDPIELAKAIRKGPDMPPAQPVADSEPVAVIDLANLDYLLSGADADVWPPEREEMGDVLLYRHAQQPVVPDESYQQLSELYHAQEKRLFKIAQRIKGPAFDKYSHSPSQAIDVLEVAIFGDDEFCRAAMLNAQPQNAPQNIPEIIPDGWIPVSEHLPKEKGVYQVWNGKYVDNVPFWFGSFQSLHSELITHWMPLPAEPQEVKSES